MSTGRNGMAGHLSPTSVTEHPVDDSDNGAVGSTAGLSTGTGSTTTHLSPVSCLSNSRSSNDSDTRQEVSGDTSHGSNDGGHRISSGGMPVVFFDEDDYNAHQQDNKRLSSYRRR
jgi:hypothetical protein